MNYLNTSQGARIVRCKDGTEHTIPAGGSKFIEGKVVSVPHGVEAQGDDDDAGEKPIAKMSTAELDAKIAELEIDPATITGTGAEGKVINKDKVAAIEAKIAENAAS